jgi:hypothetical protein
MFRHPIAGPAGREKIAGPEGGSRETLARHLATLSEGIVVVENALKNLIK